jgi:hypothetical protein
MHMQCSCCSWKKQAQSKYADVDPGQHCLLAVPARLQPATTSFCAMTSALGGAAEKGAAAAALQDMSTRGYHMMLQLASRLSLGMHVPAASLALLCCACALRPGKAWHSSHLSPGVHAAVLQLGCALVLHAGDMQHPTCTTVAAAGAAAVTVCVQQASLRPQCQGSPAGPCCSCSPTQTHEDEVM